MNTFDQDRRDARRRHGDHDAIGKALRPALRASGPGCGWAASLLVLGALGLQACGGGGEGEAAGESPDGDAEGGPARPVLTLTVTGSSARTASLAWTSVPGATGYTLERRSGSSGWAPVATAGPEERLHVDDGLTRATPYTYRVAAMGVQAVSAEQPTSTTEEEPVVTVFAEPTGEPTRTATFDAEGGSLHSADGRLRLDLPAGAAEPSLTVSLQPSSNPAPDGLGAGVRVRLDATPVKAITLSLAWDEADDLLADGMGVALQRADGSWLSLPVAAIDKSARRMVVRVSPATAARAAAPATSATAAAAASVGLAFTVVRYLDLRLSPRRATIEPGASQWFVPQARTLMQTGHVCLDDPDIGCLAMPLLETREIPLENQKTGYQRQWSVFAEPGGNALLGTLTPRPLVGAVYQAPAEVPDPNPVWISFQSRHLKSGRTVTLGASVQVSAPRWTMILNGRLDGAADIGFGYSAEAVWSQEPGTPGTYRATGTQTLNVIEIVCSATPTPATVPLPPGTLEIDHSVQPARYRLDVGSVWDTLLAGRCPDGSFGSVPARVSGRLVVEGILSADGQRIEGATSQNHIDWNWALTRRL